MKLFAWKKKKAAEEYHVPSDEFLAAVAKIKGRPAPLKDVAVLKNDVFPIAGAARKRKEAFENRKPGDLIEGEGIFVGQYSPTDRNGKGLGKIFNVFAAPRDLPETMKYVDAVRHVSRLENWHGFDGTDYATDKEIYAALKDGSYNGGWIIPTLDILRGQDVDGEMTTPDNLYAHKDKFNVAGDPGRAFKEMHWYWSSTENHFYRGCVREIRFFDGDAFWAPKNGNQHLCRPVRLVAA